MDLREDIRSLVESMLKEISAPSSAESSVPAVAPESAGVGGDGIFPDVEGAISAAGIAHRELMKLSLETRVRIIEAMRAKALECNEMISRKAQAETGFGCYKYKMLKHELVARKTPGVEDLQPVSYSDDNGLTLVERAPYGVIGAIIPSTNPSSTVINNGIGMIAGGNAVVFAPHPGAKEVSCMAISLLNDAIQSAGGPRNLLTGIGRPSIAAAGALMKHPDVNLPVVTGGPGVVKAAMNSGKKVIAAGPGNPPCVVDETADIAKAGRDICSGAGFDHNIVCICEKEIIAVASIADRLKDELKRNGAFELNREQTDAVTKLVIADPGAPGHEGAAKKDFVGKSPQYIAKANGLEVPRETKILLCEVGREHPLIWTEQLMPVIPLTRVPDVDEAIDLAVQCEHGFRHTAIMHSLNISKLSKMAKVMNCSIFVKNGPCYAGLAFGGAGFTTMTIASPTGDGLTRARTFTRERRCTLVDYFRIV